MTVTEEIQLTSNLGETHAVPYNRLPQARLSDFDETWHIWPFCKKWNIFKFRFLLPVLESHLLSNLHSTVLKANYYVILGTVICLIFHKYTIKDTFVVYYLKMLLCNM